jgi:hypothetical protein
LESSQVPDDSTRDSLPTTLFLQLSSYNSLLTTLFLQLSSYNSLPIILFLHKTFIQSRTLLTLNLLSSLLTDSWNTHVLNVHDVQWDATTTCRVPGCRRETAFATKLAYTTHLRSTHKLRAGEMDEYRIASTYRGPAFGKRRCPHQDCDDSDIQRSRRDLEAHLRSRREGGHRLKAEEATKLVDEMME